MLKLRCWLIKVIAGRMTVLMNVRLEGVTVNLLGDSAFAYNCSFVHFQRENAGAGIVQSMSFPDFEKQMLETESEREK